MKTLGDIGKFVAYLKKEIIGVILQEKLITYIGYPKCGYENKKAKLNKGR